jgi:type VI secretion system protein ImpE
MSTAQDNYREGDLTAAVSAALEEVKQNPSDAGRRGFLCELLCFAGDLERADRQLDALGHQEPEVMAGVGLFRQLIRAEQARQQFFTDGRLPEFLDQPSPVLRMHLEASVLLRDGKSAEAVELLGRAEEQRPHTAGTCDGRAFEDLRDLDDLTAPVFEVLTSNGKYYWIPIERVDTMEVHAPARPRDLLWPRVHMVVQGGPDGEVFLPALYPGSQADPDQRIRLGRVTEWRGGGGAPVRGAGQRTLLVGEEAQPLLEVRELAFRVG